MKTTHYILLVVATTASLLSGCDSKEHKTESMIYRESAFKEAQKPVQKAKELFTQEVKSTPEEHLDTLIIIQGALQDAQDIYRKKDIANWDDEALESMLKDYRSLEPQLVDNALSLLNQLVQRTQLLRQQVEDIKTRPHSAMERSPNEMIKFLSQRYNKEISDCCLIQLGRTDQLLSSNVKQHKDMIVMIRTISEKLEKMIKQENYALQLQKEIDVLAAGYKS